MAVQFFQYQIYSAQHAIIQSLISTFIYILMILIPVFFFVSWSLFYESMRFPWSFNFSFFDLECLNLMINAIVDFFVNYVIRYFSIILFVFFGGLSLYSAISERPVFSFILLTLAKKFCQPILVTYALSAIASLLFLTGFVSNSEYLESVFKPMNYGWDAVYSFLILSFLFFTMDSLIRLQVKRMKKGEKTINIIKFLDFIH